VALPIERVDLVVFQIVETLLREVLAIALHFNHHVSLLKDFFFSVVVEKVVVVESGSVEKVHVQ
jgi:hypothetical protein